jgi:hypothetical protein
LTKKISPCILEPCFAAGDHVELVSSQFQRSMKSDGNGHTEFITFLEGKWEFKNWDFQQLSLKK